MMKKFCNILILLAITVNAQVGIKTTTPTRILDVNGTSRIRTLTDKSADINYDQVLTTDTNGNIDYVPKSTLNQQYVQLFNLTTLPTSQNNSSTTPSTISTQSITLPKKALVIINFSVPINLSTAASDGRAKLLMTHLTVDGNTKIRASNSYTNSARIGTNLTGFFYNTGSFSIELAAGTHSISLEGLCFNNVLCTQGGNVPGTNFQAVALYNDF
ncbi:hypothetical protein [Chryseobacterium polytrichastri]|uniref:Uncharacterized protein n=1 Tax=Chryseobacterium polytrichastri TaxID=1302687 RepID=A0A1M6W9D8_9FLAO|nr:hypothetical protein [Chryseobacterium polytrichastri]SHK90105.1 hypothetical protein SAMN05444267_100929 [Chryseobacterium polytrichastri]